MDTGRHSLTPRVMQSFLQAVSAFRCSFRSVPENSSASARKGLLSPALSSRGGDGEDYSDTSAWKVCSRAGRGLGFRHTCMTTFSRRNKSRPRFVRRTPRILTVVPICDGHDSAIVTINFEFARHGIEVIYLGYHRSARDVVRAAVQEDVEAIGISSYNGEHIEFFSQVLRMLRDKDATNIGVFGGGGGTITAPDVQVLKRRG